MKRHVDGSEEPVPSGAGGKAPALILLGHTAPPSTGPHCLGYRPELDERGAIDVIRENRRPERSHAQGWHVPFTQK